MILIYRLKPENAVKVIQWTGNNKSEIKGFCGDKVTFLMLQNKEGTKTTEICVLKPRSIVYKDDYIIRDSHGCFMACNQEYLNEYYERVGHNWWDTKRW